MTLTATTAEKTVTVELAVPTNLGDLTVTTSPVSTRLAAIASEIRIEMKRTVESVIKIGKLLLTAKELTTDVNCGIEGPNPDARFGKWVSANFADTLPHRTLANLLNVARVYGDRDPADLENIGLSILYELAAPSTPADTRALIETKFQDGDNLTVKDVKGIVRDARNPSPSISAPAPAQDEDDLPFDPSPDGKATFVPSNTPPAPRRRKIAFPDPESLIRDKDHRAKLELSNLKLEIAGGYVEGSAHLEIFMEIYNSQINGQTVFSHMQSVVMKSLAEGDSLEEAKEKAYQAHKTALENILGHVMQSFTAGMSALNMITGKMAQAGDGCLSIAFRPETPVPEAVVAARKCLKRMGFDPDADE